MATEADLRWLREEANLPLKDAAKCLGVSGLELHLLEQHGRNVPDEAMEGVRAIYYRNQREAAEPREEEYIPGTTEQGECSHHWLIDPPAGPRSKGHCIRCGAKRDFRNSDDHPGGD